MNIFGGVVNILLCIVKSIEIEYILKQANIFDRSYHLLSDLMFSVSGQGSDG